MISKGIKLSSSKITILRLILPEDRKILDESEVVPSKLLAKQGLAIGNSIDIQGSKKSIGYKLGKDQWAFHFITDDQELLRDFLQKPSIFSHTGQVAYVATIDLNCLKIYANVPFEDRTVENKHKKPATILKLYKCDDGFYLKSDIKPVNLQSRLRNKFTKDGRLATHTGEFFITKIGRAHV